MYSIAVINQISSVLNCQDINFQNIYISHLDIFHVNEPFINSLFLNHFCTVSLSIVLF